MKTSLLHPQNQMGPELPKIRCAFHSEELLTNFCSCKRCLLPLCPSCIKIHVNQHISLNTNPQIENINDSIRQLHGKLEFYGQKFNNLYKRLAEAEFHVQEFRDKLKGKIQRVKQDLITAIQDHFKRIQVGAMQRINDLKYVKNMYKCKDYAKKTILSLKNSQRNFFAEESKIMRMMIKFQANGIKEQLDNFYQQSEQFVSLVDNNLLSYHIRDNIAQLAIDNLQHFFKIDFQQPTYIVEPRDITPLLRELYQKQAEKQVKKSLYKFISNKNTPNKQNLSQPQLQIQKKFQNPLQDKIKDFAEMISSKQVMSTSQARPSLQQITQNNCDSIFSNSNNQIINQDVYSSVKESIIKATQDLNLTLCRNTKKQPDHEPFAQRRRSLSRGKGITLMQSNTSVIDYKKSNQNHQSFLKTDLDFTFVNGRTEQVSRKCR